MGRNEVFEPGIQTIPFSRALNAMPRKPTVEIRFSADYGIQWNRDEILHEMSLARRIFITTEAAQVAGFGLAFEYRGKWIFVATTNRTD